MVALRCASRLTRCQADLNFVACDADFERVDGQSRVVGPFAVADAESPGVPRARDNALLVQVARTQRCAHVGAQVVDCEVLTVFEKHRDEALADLERLALPFGNRAHLGYGDEI